MKLKSLTAMSLLSAATVFTLGDVAAYSVVAVDNGGTISGTTALSGKRMPAKIFKVEKTPEVCGEEDRQLEMMQGDDGKLAGVVVFLEKVESGKAYVKEEAIEGPPPGKNVQVAGGGAEFPGTTFRPEKCVFGAFTGVVAEGKLMKFENADPVKHSPHTYSVKGRVKKTMHNQDLVGDGTLDLTVKFKKKAKVLKLECDQHDHMQNWFHRVENPYYAISAADGSYTIDQVPAGTYKLMAWHPKFKKALKQDVDVAAGGSVSADFDFKSKVK